MSATIQTARRPRSHGKAGSAERRAQRTVAAHSRATQREHQREQQARQQQATRERQQRAQARLEHHTTQQRRILGLLGRGAGVTQILDELSTPQDSARESLARASHLRRLLQASDSDQTGGVQINPGKLARTLAFLDRHIAQLAGDTPPTGRTRPTPASSRPGTRRHTMPSRAAGAPAARS
jgi:hypothetical protein